MLKAPGLSRSSRSILCSLIISRFFSTMQVPFEYHLRLILVSFSFHLRFEHLSEHPIRFLPDHQPQHLPRFRPGHQPTRLPQPSSRQPSRPGIRTARPAPQPAGDRSVSKPAAPCRRPSRSKKGTAWSLWSAGGSLWSRRKQKASRMISISSFSIFPNLRFQNASSLRIARCIPQQGKARPLALPLVGVQRPFFPRGYIYNPAKKKKITSRPKCPPSLDFPVFPALLPVTSQSCAFPVVGKHWSHISPGWFVSPAVALYTGYVKIASKWWL